jgi:hypothetical protein
MSGERDGRAKEDARMTKKIVTDAELQSLQNGAAAAGDIEMAAIAELARTGEFAGDDWALDTAERLRVNAMTQRDALRRCVEVIRDAQAIRDAQVEEDS